MRKIGITFIVLVVVAALLLSLKVIKTSLLGHQKESFTIIGTLHSTTYQTMPNVPVVEIYHDGEDLVLMSIEKTENGYSLFPEGSQIALMVKDFSEFGGPGFEGKKYRITLTRFVESDGFEYWRCKAKKI